MTKKIFYPNMLTRITVLLFIGLIANTASSQCSLTVNPKFSEICKGDCITFSVSGAVTYLWSPGNITTANPVFCPEVTTTYTVIGTNANGDTCSATAVVIVNPLPNATLTPENPILCKGEAVTICPQGDLGNTYLWNTGTLAACISVSPSATTTYVATVTSVNGCKKTIYSVVTVNPIPDISITKIVKTDTTILTAAGADKYLWSTGDTTASVSVSPKIKTVYTVTGTDVNKCRSSASVTLNVFFNPFSSRKIIPAGKYISIGIRGMPGPKYIYDEELQPMPNVDISPNPGNGVFCIYLKGNSDADIEMVIKNIAGQTVSSSVIPKTSSYEIVNISNMGKGMYFAYFRSQHFLIVHKLLVR